MPSERVGAANEPLNILEEQFRVADAAVPLEVEVNNDPEPAPVDSTQAELQATKARMAELEAKLQQQPDLATLLASMPAPKVTVQQQVPAPVQPAFDQDAYKKGFNENLYENPYDKILDLTGRVLSPAIRQLAEANLANARRWLTVDPERSATAKEYMTEIDQEIQTLPDQARLTDPDVYLKAHDRVISRHISDIVQKRVAASLAQQQSATVQPPAQPAGAVHISPSITGAPSVSAKKIVRLTSAEVAAGRLMGMNEADYAAYLVRKGKKKLT